MMEIWERTRSLRNLQFFAFTDIKVDKNVGKVPKKKYIYWQKMAELATLLYFAKRQLCQSLQNSIFFAYTPT